MKLQVDMKITILLCLLLMLCNLVIALLFQYHIIVLRLTQSPHNKQAGRLALEQLDYWRLA